MKERAGTIDLSKARAHQVNVGREQSASETTLCAACRTLTGEASVRLACLVTRVTTISHEMSCDRRIRESLAIGCQRSGLSMSSRTFGNQRQRRSGCIYLNKLGMLVTRKSIRPPHPKLPFVKARPAECTSDRSICCCITRLSV